MPDSQPSYRGEQEMQAGSGRFECDSIRKDLAGSAYEFPFAPGDRFVDGDEVNAGDFLDEIGLAEPLVVGAAFELNHGGEGVHFIRKAPRNGIS